MEQSTINYQNRQKNFLKVTLRTQITIFYIVKRERGFNLVSGSLCCIRIYFFCVHQRIRSSKHGWNKPWLVELLVIRTTKRGPVACRPDRTGIFCKHVIVNTRRNGTLKCSSSNPPRGYAVSISGTERFFREGMAQVRVSFDSREERIALCRTMSLLRV